MLPFVIFSTVNSASKCSGIFDRLGGSAESRSGRGIAGGRIEAQRLIRQPDLNSPKIRKWRVMWMRIVSLVSECDPVLDRQPGHSHADTTAIYAERAMELARFAMERLA